MSRYQDVVFPDPLILEALGGTPINDNGVGKLYDWDLYQLQREFRVLWYNGSITAPALFINDRASIPSIAHSIITKDGPWQRGSIIHDWVFVNKGVPGCETFELANELFMECMIADGASWIERNAIIAAVDSDIGRERWEDDN